MIPPCDPAILESNPQFKRLYQHLTTTLLNADGSTRANDAQPARKAVLEELKSCRMRIAKTQIKRQILRQLAFDADSGLPDDYRDPVAVITLYLESSPSRLVLDSDSCDGADILSLLEPDIDMFYSSIPALVRPFSNALSSAVDDLRTVANAGKAPTPSQAPSAVAPAPPEPSRSRVRNKKAQTKIKPQVALASQLNERLQKLRQMQLSELPAARTRMAATAAEILATRAEVLEQTIVLLERAKHGTLARATKAKAEHLSTVAEGVEGKLSVMKLDITATIHTPENVAALSRYRQHLRDTRERLEERQIQVLNELKAYEFVDSGGGDENDSTRNKRHFETGPMKEIARRYGSLMKEIEAVKMEIQRLSG